MTRLQMMIGITLLITGVILSASIFLLSPVKLSFFGMDHHSLSRRGVESKMDTFFISSQTSPSNAMESTRMKTIITVAKTKPKTALDSEIVITVLSGSGVNPPRIPMLHRLFSSYVVDENNPVTVAFFSDEGMENLHFPDVKGIFFLAVSAKECGDGQTDALCCKTAFSYAWVYNNMKSVNWIMRATDDTFVHIPNLVLYLNYLNPRALIYAGDRYQRPPDYDYMTGGCGWLISSAVLQKLSVNFRAFLNTTEACYDDVDFGRYMRVLQIPRLQAPGFRDEYFHMRDTLVLNTPFDFHPNHLSILYRPVSFHMRMGPQAGHNFATVWHVTEADIHLLRTYIDRLDHLPIL